MFLMHDKWFFSNPKPYNLNLYCVAQVLTRFSRRGSSVEPISNYGSSVEPMLKVHASEL